MPLRPVPPLSRRVALQRALLLAGAAALGLAGCQALAPDRLRFSEADLDAMLAKQFPLERRVLEVIDLRLTDPRLALQPERNRIATTFDLAADDRLFGGRAAARVSLDCALRYEPADHSLRLRDVRVKDLGLSSESSPLRGQAQRIGALAAERLLENLAIWRMKADQVERMGRLGVEPKAITVRADGIEIALGPVAR